MGTPAEPSTNDLLSSPAPPAKDPTLVGRNLERQMSKEGAAVLRDIEHAARESLRARPLRSSQSGTRLSGRFSLLSRDDSLPSYGARFVNVERVSEREASEDPNVLGSFSLADTLEDDTTRKPVYTICPRTGRKLFRAHFDVQGFELADLRVKLCSRRLVVFAMRQETDNGRQSTTEFCKKLRLPDDVNTERLESYLNDGNLTVEAPAITRSTSLSMLLERSNDLSEQLNVPVIRDGEVGKMLHLLVEVGCVFKANNVIVKLNGKHKLLVLAERKEETGHQRLSAALTREFNLSRPIYPHSLKAGLTHDGILKVTARIQEEEEIVDSPPTMNGDVKQQETGPLPNGSEPEQ